MAFVVSKGWVLCMNKSVMQSVNKRPKTDRSKNAMLSYADFDVPHSHSKMNDTRHDEMV